MPGIGSAARDRDQRELVDPQVAQHLRHFAVVVGESPGRIERGIAQAVAFHRHDTQFQALAHGIKESDQFRRTATGSDPADEQDRPPASLPGVGEMDGAAFLGGQPLDRGADRIELVREDDRIDGRGLGLERRGHAGQGDQCDQSLHRTGSVSRLRSSTSICFNSSARFRLRHSHKYAAAETGKPTSIDTSALPSASATGPV